MRSAAWLCALAILLAAGVASTHGAGSAVLWAARATFALFIALGVGMNCEDRRLHAGHQVERMARAGAYVTSSQFMITLPA